MAANGIAPPPRKLRGKKFSYQSTVRILEKRKLEEKLAREVAEKEKHRLKEMEAMKKVKPYNTAVMKGLVTRLVDPEYKLKLSV